MNVFKGTWLQISQTDTLLLFIMIANLDPSAENASSGSKRSMYKSLVILGEGVDMLVMKVKFKLFVPPESE